MKCAPGRSNDASARGGGLIVKTGIVDLTGDDRAMIYGALLWLADKFNSEHVRELWAEKGRNAFGK